MINEYFKEELLKVSKLNDLENQYLLKILINKTLQKINTDPVGLSFLENMTNPSKTLELAENNLFISGYFPERLLSSINNPDYFDNLGIRMYHTLSISLKDSFFEQVSLNYLNLRKTLNEVSFNKYNDNQKIIILYNQWIKTKNPNIKNKLNTLLKKSSK